MDLVISSTEFIHLLARYAGNSDAAVLREYVSSFTPDEVEGRDQYEHMMRSITDQGHFASPILPTSTSGSYLEYIYRRIVLEDGQPAHPMTLNYGRNKDIAEAEYVTCGGKTVRFAYIYGFRNIQSLIMKMKRRRVTYDYVEVMACPSGCINGGGQIKVAERESPDDIALRVEATSSLYKSNRVESGGGHSRLSQFIYSVVSEKDRKKVLHTQFHAVPKLEEIAPLAVKW